MQALEIERPPRSEAELLERASALAGRTLGELAQALAITIPEDPRRSKGLAGRLLERALAADAHGAPEPDFRQLGIELKSIPLDRRGRPRESTFVCSIRLADMETAYWESSRVRRKLARVLWVPIESAPDLPLPNRRIGAARIWSPSPEQERILREDWETLVGHIACGEFENLTAHRGRYLQIRPKAAHAGIRERAHDEAGAPTATLPRGFYLRARFTAGLFGDS
ncbi:MAG: DNA mismatch repair endonuclease MutH [Myxococcales bacterium]|nr:DNA mismatch repair endonuclease MutH [Myxococcales bacterium]